MSQDDGNDQKQNEGISRRDVLTTGAAAGAAAAIGAFTAKPAGASVRSQGEQGSGRDDQSPERLRLVNGKIHTMDDENRVVSSVVIEDGRFVEVGGDGRSSGATQTINLKGRTVVPGIIDAHNHIVLVGNRPGHHVLVEHVFTIPEALGVYEEFAQDVPDGEWITTIGPIAARQFEENRLPTLQELDVAVPNHPIYVHAAQGGSRVNSMARAILEPLGVEIDDDGAVQGGGGFGSGGAAITVQFLRATLLTPETRRRSARDALQYYTTLGITTHRDGSAFPSEEPAGGIATENIFTMHEPFLELDRVGEMPARMRIEFGHYDGSDIPFIAINPNNDAADIPTLRERLKNSFQFYGNDWLRTGGIGEHTGAGITGLRAIAEARWRAEDHALSVGAAEAHIANREAVHAETDISDLRWILSHVPAFPPDLADRFHAMGGGVLVGWGPLRTGTNVGPPYRMLYDHPIEVGWHSDGGDISMINPWLNFYTMTTGRNLQGDHILGDQTLTRQEVLRLATAANKWFINEDDVGSIEVGNHADLAALNKDYFTVPDEEIRTINSVLTLIGGSVAHTTGEVA